MEQWSRWPLLLLSHLQVRTPCFIVQPCGRPKGASATNAFAFARGLLGQSYRRRPCFFLSLLLYLYLVPFSSSTRRTPPAE